MEASDLPNILHRKAFSLKAHEKLTRRSKTRLSLEGLLERYFK